MKEVEQTTGTGKVSINKINNNEGNIENKTLTKSKKEDKEGSRNERAKNSGK